MPAGSALWLLLCMLLAGLAGCRRDSDQTQIAQAIAALQAAIEQGRPADLVEHLADDFEATGGLDRAALRRLLQAQRLRHSSLGVTIGPLDIAVDGDRATARFVAVTSGGDGGWLPSEARSWRVRSEWRRDDGDWRLVEADWGEEGR